MHRVKYLLMQALSYNYLFGYVNDVSVFKFVGGSDSFSFVAR